MLTSVAAPQAVSLDTKTRRVRLGVVCPMANERDTAERFVREVLAACEPFGFASVTFFAWQARWHRAQATLSATPAPQRPPKG